jgi:glycosyltransferase involved in cell wall biosynthesis
VYITPYHNLNQIVSGTLSYALGCGRAIISTPYLYAKDALGQGRGVLVASRHPQAIGDTLIELLGDPARRERLQQQAYAYGKQMRWPKVAAAYVDLFREVHTRARPHGGTAAASY